MRIFLSFAFLLAAGWANESRALQVNVLDRDNFTTNQSLKLDQVITVLNQVLNSPEFKERVLNFSYKGKTQFVQNNGLTNQQVYDLLMSGAEKLPKKTVGNNLADMYLSIYYPPWYKRFSSAVAFTSSSDPYLNIYNSYYNNSSISDLAGTLVHEWTHKMGFDHDYKATAQRPYSVPYAVGTIISDLVQAYLK